MIEFTTITINDVQHHIPEGFDFLPAYWKLRVHLAEILGWQVAAGKYKLCVVVTPPDGDTFYVKVDEDPPPAGNNPAGDEADKIRLWEQVADYVPDYTADVTAALALIPANDTSFNLRRDIAGPATSHAAGPAADIVWVASVYDRLDGCHRHTINKSAALAITLAHIQTLGIPVTYNTAGSRAAATVNPPPLHGDSI